MTDPTISHYHQHATHYQAQYDSVAAQDVHATWAPLLKSLTAGLALDIGAGSARDALWLTQQGWQVTAVEPAQNLRQLGQIKTGSKVAWSDAQLPTLEGLKRPEQGYDLILLSAVWMHLKPEQRPAAFHRLCDYLSAKGMLIITLRFGPSDPQRPMYSVSTEELETLAQQRALSTQDLSEALTNDCLQRHDVHWKTLCLRPKHGHSV
ncbi:class I SAM-dependent methyltransferase [Amphritea opalescens]|uniref:Class I SAM-dependent methyltransferase n=1 Tax=Amphritea opalescens TaxID=2490544 RepID=A0A430KLF3_9GAMM|nr:class I SAM-dependent methyltransferase [Amphritea opalescens]RTE64292.1 class I SAM-dependent methyltransferase [Amphritea opalescens]